MRGNLHTRWSLLRTVNGIGPASVASVWLILSYESWLLLWERHVGGSFTWVQVNIPQEISNLYALVLKSSIGAPLPIQEINLPVWVWGIKPGTLKSQVQQRNNDGWFKVVYRMRGMVHRFDETKFTVIWGFSVGSLVGVFNPLQVTAIESG